jgi:thiosulfate sulfurtransferase
MDTFKRISAQKAHEIMGTDNKAVTIVDLRDANSFAQGHIARAQFVNDENINVFLQEADKEKPLICYCYRGISSQQAAMFFADQGFKQVYSIDGGWESWRANYD